MGIFAGTRHEGQFRHFKPQTQTRGCRHLQAVTQQAITSHIGAGAQAEFNRQSAGVAIQFFHPTNHLVNILRGGFLLFQCGGGHPKPERLGENQGITRIHTSLGKHFTRVDKTDHHQSILGLLILHGVPPGDHHTGFQAFLRPTAQDLGVDLNRQLRW